MITHTETTLRKKPQIEILTDKPKISPYAYAGLIGKSIGNKETVMVSSPENICKNIAEKICEYFDMTIDVLKEKNRKRYILDARQVCMYLMRKRGITAMAIGKFFDKDHTTVLWAVESVQDKIDTEEDYRRKVIGAQIFVSGGYKN